MTGVVEHFGDDGGDIVRGARISDDGLYRYTLLRRWDDGDFMLWVMLNPSTADADLDDATIRRCMYFARREGYSGIHVVNLYARRATLPRDCFAAADPVGPMNDHYLLNEFTAASATQRMVVCAWGGNARPERVQEVVRLMPNALNTRCFGKTDAGQPLHPLSRGKKAIRNDAPLLPLDLHPGHARATG